MCITYVEEKDVRRRDSVSQEREKVEPSRELAGQRKQGQAQGGSKDSPADTHGHRLDAGK